VEKFGLPAKIVNLFLPNTIFMDQAEFMPMLLLVIRETLGINDIAGKI
jgi:hypothetical protein